MVVATERECTVAGLRVELLGPPHVQVDGSPLEVDTRKAVALLARLVVAGPERREALTALLWPESDESRGRASLRRTLSALNKGLGQRWVDADRDEVRLERDDSVWSDTDAFAALRRRADAHDHDPTSTCTACVQALEDAAALHRGEFLAGFSLRDTAAFDAWSAAVGERYQRELGEALDLLVQIHARRDELDAAIRHARRRLELEPLHEPTHRRLMLLHAWRGQRGDAMRQYRECVAVLERELGVPPLERTSELHEAIVAGRLPDRPSPAPLRPPTPPTRTQRPNAPLVGRDDELERLRSARAASEHAGEIVVVEGEAGIGKTRLVDELVREARDQGAPTAVVRCYAEEQTVAYGVAAELLRAAVGPDPERLASIPPAWLRETARLVPEVLALRPDLEPDGAIDTDEARRRFLEAFRQVLAAGLDGTSPGLVVIDDVQWADEPSQDALAYLLRRLTDLQVCVVLVWRTELLPDDHPLQRLVAGGPDRGHATRITLDRLSDDEVSELVRATGATVTAEFEGRLIEESEGLPLFAVEHLRAIVDGAGPDPWETPAGIRDLIEERLARLSDTARQALSAAAVIGRSFAFETLLEASGRDPEEVVTALEELADADVVAEVDGVSEPRYDFRHDKLRTVVYEQTSTARRRLLHGRVADALRSRERQRREGGLPAALIAHHLRLGGREEEAAAAHATAASEARELSAHVEAIDHLRAALDLGHPDPGPLHETLGELLTLRGDYAGALHTLEAAAAHADDAEDLARIEHRLATVHERRGDWASAEAHIDAGLAALRAGGPDRLHARLRTDLALVAHRRGESDRATTEARRALELTASDGADVARAQTLNLLGMLARTRNEPDEAVEHLEESLAIAEALDDLPPRVAALNNLALAYAERGDVPAGLELAKTALGLCRRLGDRHREAAILNNLGDLLHRAGQRDEALDYIKQAVAIFSEVGEPERHEPEIWKLVDW